MLEAPITPVPGRMFCDSVRAKAALSGLAVNLAQILSRRVTAGLLDCSIPTLDRHHIAGYSATARMAGQRQQGWPVAAWWRDGVADGAGQGLCRGARQIGSVVMTSDWLVSCLLSLAVRRF